MRRVGWVVVILLLAGVVAACGRDAGAESAAEEVAAEPGGLSENYADALSVPAQLIVGSLRLEDSDLAIDEAEATELLTLWQAYQSLSSSDTAAAAEVQAVVNQIQDTMSPQQIDTIAAMKLTSEDTTALIQERGVAFGRNGTDSGADGSGQTGGGFGGGFPRGGFEGGFSGGGPPGGFGGGGPGGDFGGGNFGDLSPEERATAIAERVGSQSGDFATRGLLNMLITSLQLKTGEINEADLQAAQAARGRLRWLSVISEATGIPVETLQEGVAGGDALADVIMAQGGDLAAVEAALQEAMSSIPNLQADDVQQQIDDLLHATPSSE